MIEKLSPAQKTTKAIHDVLSRAEQVTGVYPYPIIFDSEFDNEPTPTEITVDSQNISPDRPRRGACFVGYYAVKHLFNILQRQIQKSKPKGVKLSPLTDKDLWTNNSQIARFKITCTPEVDQNEAISIVEKTLQEFARKLNYSNMDMTGAVSHSYFDSIRGYAKGDEKAFREAADTLLSIGQDANVPSIVSAVESIYKDMDKALSTLEEKRLVSELRYKREQLGFNSIKELSEHSRSDGKGFAGRIEERENTHKKKNSIKLS